MLATVFALVLSPAAARAAAPPAPPAAPVAAPPAADSAPAPVDVIEVSGLIDDVMVDFVGDALRAAESDGAQVLVLQIDSRGGVASQADVDALAFRLGHSGIPVAAWVGPSGARAYGSALQLVRGASIAGVAPGTRLGRAPEPVFDRPEPLQDRTVSGAEALARGLVEIDAPTLGDLVVELDGRTVAGRTLATARVVEGAGEEPRREAIVPVRFAKPDLVARLLHSVSSPEVAYLLLVAGLLLIVFEFFTAGVGVAGAVGAACLVLSAFGLVALPTRPWALALVAVGILGYAIDVQVGTPRAWSVIGTLSLAAGSLRLYRGLSPSLLSVVLVVVGVALFMVAGMPAMIRARFSTPTIGRESMIGELGVALARVDPEGTVEVRGAPWRARTNRATPVAAGEPVRVVGLDGLLLEVEPEQGGAREARH